MTMRPLGRPKIDDAMKASANDANIIRENLIQKVAMNLLVAEA
ncbi:MAG: hypothetical protein Q8M03_12870 [Legionella sp.]|nr:hypothetical protein [Legionella sp.]